MSEDGMPPDPFPEPHGGRDPLAEATGLGSVIFDALLDALRHDGLFALYPAVRELSRDDLERVALAMVIEVGTSGERLRPPDLDPPAPRGDGLDLIPDGRLQMIRLFRGLARGGERGLLGAVRGSSNDELRVMVRGVLEEAWGNLLRRRADAEGPDR